MASYPPDKPPLTLVVLLIIGGVGLAVVFLAVFDSTSWVLLTVGFVVLLGAISGVWVIQKDRDRPLR